METDIFQTVIIAVDVIIRSVVVPYPPMEVTSSSMTEEEVMELALSSLHDVHVPLLPPLLSKDDILHCLVSHHQVCDTTEDRMLIMFLLTDLVTAAAVQPHFLDMFIKDSSGQSRNKIFSKLGTQWSKIFRRINFSPKSERPDKEVMTALHSALGRCYSLLESSCPHITKLLLCH